MARGPVCGLTSQGDRGAGRPFQGDRAMSDTSSLSGDVLSTAALRRVDEVCERFEDAWRAGLRPRQGTHSGA